MCDTSLVKKTSLLAALDVCGQLGLDYLNGNYRWNIKNASVRDAIKGINLKRLQSQLKVLEDNNLPAGEAIKSQVQIIILAADVAKIEEREDWQIKSGSRILSMYATTEDKELLELHQRASERLLDYILRYVTIMSKWPPKLPRERFGGLLF